MKDVLLHAAAGLGLVLLALLPSVWVWWWPAIGLTLLMFVLGFLREQAQQWNSGGGWFRWINKHRMLEAAGWAFGGAVGAAVWVVCEMFA